jgi:hypothetical protein
MEEIPDYTNVDNVTIQKILDMEPEGISEAEIISINEESDHDDMMISQRT